MFGSRRYRPPKQPLTSATVDPNATTAAAAVFKRQESNPSLLSSAAAAAALQSHPTAPTRVADVQTKRTLRRSASVASTATGASDTHPRPGLRRRGSSASMTERTFRTPSPHRLGSSGFGQQHTFSTMDGMPPVPALPKDIDADSHLSGVGCQQIIRSKSTSLGMKTTPLRVASQKLGQDDAPSWFGAAKMGDPGNVRRTDPAMASPPSSPPQQPLDQSPVDGARPSSRTSSINFSYPARIRVGSPTASPVESRFPAEMATQGAQHHVRADDRQQAHPQASKRHLSESAVSPSRRRAASSSADETLVYDPNSRRMVRRADLLAAEQAVLDASRKPVKTKRKKQTSQNAGSYLAQGTMGRTRSISSKPDKIVESNASRNQAQRNSIRGVEEDIEEPAVKAIIASPKIEAKRIEQQRAQDQVTQSNLFEDKEEIESVILPDSRALIRRQPSTVKEESEPEERDPVTVRQRTVSEALDSVPTRQRLFEPGSTATHLDTKEQSSSQPLYVREASPAARGGGQDRGVIDSAMDAQDFASHSPAAPRPNEPGGTTDTLRDRTQSISPPRQAHFGPVQNNLRIIHSPPPRSVSPRKSALKYSSPIRGASPSDEASDVSMSTSQRDEQSLTRKKSVRVSFDDGNTVVVGESASTNESNSPVIASPQSRRPWYSNLGRTKKDLGFLDDDEIMKPRPALPSFGSVRDKKPRELSPVEVERPLVRPMPDTVYSPSTGSPSLPPSISSTVAEDGKSDIGPLGQSNDHAVGAILGKAFEERNNNSANISRLREPLPPVVTSVEGSGYLSSSSNSSTPVFEESGESHEIPATVEPHHPTTREPENAFTSAAPGGSTNTDGVEQSGVIREINIPSISISQPSPGLPETKSSNRYFVDVPGRFPVDDSDLSTDESRRSTAPTPPDSSNTTVPVSTVQASTTGATAQAPVTSQPTHLIPVEPPSDSESSIYSDAYEDLSEIEGDGFLSLNAVLDGSPAPNTQEAPALREANARKQEVPEQVAPRLEPELSVATTVVDSHPPELGQDDWEKAKAYWRTLTTDKRAQLEKEAIEEAGIDGDLEEINPAQKPKKKKSIERRNSERKALAVHLAQQMVAQQQTAQSRNPERNYMIKPGTRWTEPDNNSAPIMRATLRGESQQKAAAPSSGNAPHFRKSMRSDWSAQSNEKARTPALKQGRAASFPAPEQVSPPRGTTAGQGQRSLGLSKQADNVSGLSPIKRRDSTGSESSFKRARLSSSGHQGLAFRKSMRQASPTPLPSADRQPKRFSLRSLSPAGSSSRQGPEYPPISLATTGNQMRRTLRDSSDERKSPAKVHMPSFGKKSAKKQASKSKFSSRFGDSSDEDDVGGHVGFRSRFENSSDEDVVASMPVPLTAAGASRNSAPLVVPTAAPGGRHLRNQNSIASTALPEELEGSEELPDSSDNENHKPAGANTAAVTEPRPLVSRTNSGPDAELRRSRSGRGGLIVTTSKTAPVIGNTTGTPVQLTTGHPQSSHSKRGSILSVLKRKKHNPSSTTGASDKISRPGISESAARRDTRLERSVDQLRGIRSNDALREEVDESEDGVGVGVEGEEKAQSPQSPVSPFSPPRSPKLQKRILSVSRTTSGTGTGFETTATTGAGAGDFDGGEKEVFGGLKRPATSGNLGTRTLSGGGGVGSGQQGQQGPGFLQDRTVSSGVLSLEGLSSVGGTPKKKKFGALRRMFRLND